MNTNEHIDDLETPDADGVKGGIPTVDTIVERAAANAERRVNDTIDDATRIGPDPHKRG